MIINKPVPRPEPYRTAERERIYGRTSSRKKFAQQILACAGAAGEGPLGALPVLRPVVGPGANGHLWSRSHVQERRRRRAWSVRPLR